MKYLILFSFLFLSCSKIETGLNFAPRIATSKIDDAFDFDSNKLSRIRKQIDSDLQASKKNLALKIASHLEFLQKSAENPDLKLEQILIFFDEISETQTAMINSFKTSSEVVFKDLSEDEVKTFKKYSDKKYEEELEKAKDLKGFTKKKRQNFFKNYEMFLDDLTSQQEKMLIDFIEKNINYFTHRIQERQKFSEEFYLKIKSHEPVLDFFLAHYEGKNFADIKDSVMKNYLKQFFQLQIDIWKITTEKQKSYFKKTLNSYKEQFQKIANP